MTFAANTSVPAERTRMEIEKTLYRYGAESFFYGQDTGKVIIGFRFHDRVVRIGLPIPDVKSPEFTMTGTKWNAKRRTQTEALKRWEQAVRQRWRALLLVFKAKLEAIEVGVSTFENEFLAYTVLPNGKTVGEWAVPQLESVYESGAMPPLLSGGS